MLDGQNMFDRATAFAGQPWDADEIHDKLLDHGWIRPFFIVAIQHGVSREDLYTPYRDKHYNVGGKLPLTAMMIRKEIEPVIRRRYRLLNGPENTGIIGSSLGGLAAFHLGLLYPARFGHVGAMSASLWWSDFKSHRRIKSKALKVSSTRFWLDVGTRESPAPENTVLQVRTVAQALENRGFDVTFYTDVGAWHTERVWRRRIRDVFRWMFGRRRIKRAA